MRSVNVIKLQGFSSQYHAFTWNLLPFYELMAIATKSAGTILPKLPSYPTLKC